MAKTLAQTRVGEFHEVNPLFSEEMNERYDLSYPQLWECVGGEWCEFPHLYTDPYELIRNYGRTSIRGAVPELDSVVLVMSGWGAKLPAKYANWDEYREAEHEGGALPPSQMEGRERVVMLYAMGRDGSSETLVHTASGEVISESYGFGALMEACEYLGLCVWKMSWVRGIFAAYSDLRRAALDAGQEPDPDTVRWYVERVTAVREMLGHVLGDAEGWGFDPATLGDDMNEETTERG